MRMKMTINLTFDIAGAPHNGGVAKRGNRHSDQVKIFISIW